MRSFFGFIIVALSSIALGCAGGDSNGGGGAGGTVEVGNIIGQISLVGGDELADADVKAGGLTTTTDTRGVFRLENVPAGTVNVLVTEPGYTRGHRRVQLSDGQSQSVSIKVMAKQTMTLADASVGGVVSGSDGVKLTLPANAFRDGSGNPVSGSVDVQYALLASSETIAAAPGGMIAASGSEEVALESFGMVDVSFAKDDEPLTFEGMAELSFPLTAGHGFGNGERAGLYSFDEEAGVWREEGQGTVQDGQFVADVDHFSWWNCDEPLSDKSCFTGRLLDPTGGSVVGANIDITGVDYLTNLSTVTDDSGDFCITVKRGSTNTLSAFSGDNTGFYVGSTTQVAGTDPTQCSLGGCVDIGDFTMGKVFSNCETPTVGDTDHVYVMTTGNAAQDDAVETALTAPALGQTVTMGVPYTSFVDVDLSPYDAVLLQANYNWASGDMPAAGQLQLVDWVNCGGGLVTVEWVLWKTAASSDFEVLDHALPANPTTDFTYSGTDITYAQAISDPIINAGLPSQITFPAVDYAGTEISMEARPGSKLFYNSVNLDDGMVGWDYNHGRVVCVSTVAGPAQMENANYARMLSNSLDWVRDISR